MMMVITLARATVLIKFRTRRIILVASPGSVPIVRVAVTDTGNSRQEYCQAEGKANNKFRHHLLATIKKDKQKEVR